MYNGNSHNWSVVLRGTVVQWIIHNDEHMVKGLPQRARAASTVPTRQPNVDDPARDSSLDGANRHHPLEIAEASGSSKNMRKKPRCNATSLGRCSRRNNVTLARYKPACCGNNQTSAISSYGEL